MIRIKVSTSSSGTQDASHFTYTFPLNPVEVDLKNSYDIVGVETLFGAQNFQQTLYDHRIRTLSWKSVPLTSTVGGSLNFKPQLASIKSWVGNIRYINFGTLKPLTNFTSGNDWVKVRITDCQVEYKPGSAVIADVVLFFQPEQ
jgi:hypothetical protein